MAQTSADPEGQTSAQLARVVDVNTLTYTVDVITEFTNRHIQDIPFASPYCNSAQGEGFTIIPEVGSLALVLIPGDGSEEVLVGFLMTPERGDTERYRGNRPMTAQPGDTFMTTRDGNFIYLHRGGSLTLGATPLAQRMYVPLNNLIRDICQEYKLEAIGGTLDWKIEDTQFHNPKASLPLSARELATDLDPSIFVRFGSLAEDETTIPSTFREGASNQYPANSLNEAEFYTHTTQAGAAGVGAGIKYIEIEVNRLEPEAAGPDIGRQKTNDSGEGQVPPAAPAGRKFILRIDREGNHFSRTEGAVNTEIKGKCFIRMEDDFTHHVLGGHSLAVGTVPDPFPAATVGSLEEKVQTNTTREAGQTMTDQCRFRVIEVPEPGQGYIALGSPNAIEPAVLGNLLYTWLVSHVHGPPGSPPATPPPPGILSRKVYVE